MRRLAENDSAVAGLEPRVAPRVFARDGFAITIWTYFEPVRGLPPAEYAQALMRLHADLGQIDVTTPHFMDRVAATQRDVANRGVTSDLAETDRALLADTLRNLRGSIVNRRAAEQLLHGEPHPWNVLTTKNGPLFMDFENAVQRPVEYDLSWVPNEVSDCYPDADQDLVGECRGVVLAIIATHRWSRDDQHPSGRDQEWRSSTSCERVHPGRRSIPFIGSYRTVAQVSSCRPERAIKNALDQPQQVSPIGASRAGACGTPACVARFAAELEFLGGARSNIGQMNHDSTRTTLDDRPSTARLTCINVDVDGHTSTHATWIIGLIVRWSPLKLRPAPRQARRQSANHGSRPSRQGC